MNKILQNYPCFWNPSIQRNMVDRLGRQPSVQADFYRYVAFSSCPTGALVIKMQDYEDSWLIKMILISRGSYIFQILTIVRYSSNSHKVASFADLHTGIHRRGLSQGLIKWIVFRGMSARNRWRLISSRVASVWMNLLTCTLTSVAMAKLAKILNGIPGFRCENGIARSRVPQVKRSEIDRCELRGLSRRDFSYVREEIVTHAINGSRFPNGIYTSKNFQ